MFRAILLLKMAKTQILKRHIFRLDRHISKLFSVLRSLCKVLSDSNIRYPIVAKLKFGAKFVTLFSH